MTEDLKTDKLTKGLIIFVVIVHLIFFLLEAVFWMEPAIHNPLLELLNNPVSLEYSIQAPVLRNLFINQGFYNLFLAAGGLGGLYLIRQKLFPAGYVLILFVCFSAAGAGVVLAFSTKAYLLAFLQAGPALLAILRIYPLFKSVLKA